MSTSKSTQTNTDSSTLGPYTPTLILHGGAGAISRSTLPPSLYTQYHASLLSYLTSTQSLLLSGGTAVDAACHAVSLMEDDPLFNCGRGSVFTTHGEIEMEASIGVTSIHSGSRELKDCYEGQIKRSAAVSMIRRTRHPIFLAREVLKMGDGDGGMGGTGEMHGHLSGAGVERWGWNDKGLERKGRRWFWTRRRWEEHRRGLKHQQQGLDKADEMEEFTCSDDEPDFDDDNEEPSVEENSSSLDSALPLPSQGTVGAVCMDSWGTIAVATSTGGLTNKLPGRIGDTPTVGAGFWAESWDEEIGEDQPPQSESRSGMPFIEKLGTGVRQGLDFWLGDCMTPSQSETRHDRYDISPEARTANNCHASEKQGLLSHVEQMMYPASKSARRRAVAMSGTGNGDSFLRTNACRTAAAMARFSPADSISLAKAVHAVAGPGGELQQSAGDRWGKTGQGEGGIIGIEVIDDRSSTKKGNVVFDFNCGGLWRAYFEKDKDGHERPRVMVFREEY